MPVLTPAAAVGHLKSNSVGPLWSSEAKSSQARMEAKQLEQAQKRMLRLAQHRSVMVIVWFAVRISILNI